MKLNKKSVNVKLNGKTITAIEGTAISDIIGMEKHCGGRGICGKCKVIAKGALSEITPTEKKHLSEKEINSDVRLACIAKVLGECEITALINESEAEIITEGEKLNIRIEPSFSKYGVAIDVGTTTLASRIYDIKGRLLASSARLNPQIKWGADVVSRIESAIRGEFALLSNSVRQAINEMLFELVKKAKISVKDIDFVTVTGNTAMLYLLVGESVEPLSASPFELKRFFGEIFTAEELSFYALMPNVEIYIPPCISAFVGADISCALLATEIYKNNKPLMLIDIGTNGEIALWDGKSLTVSSTAAGPAFEGVGISMGMRASFGAIDRVKFVRGIVRAHVIGDAEAKGICGSGLVDAIASLIDAKIIDGGGYMDYDEISIIPPVKVTQKDIRNVQLAKSAICAGMLTLLEEKGISVDNLEALYIAGGFGKYLNTENAEKIGLLPPNTAKKVKTVGNAALDGASILLLNKDKRFECEKVAKSAELLELATSKIFADYYIKGMRFGNL